MQQLNRATVMALETAANKAAFQLQYNTGKAVSFMRHEVSRVTAEQALEVFQRVVKPVKASK